MKNKFSILLLFFFKLFSSDEAGPSYITPQIQDIAILITESYIANGNKVDRELLEFVVEKVKDENQFECIMGLLDFELSNKKIYNALKNHGGLQQAFNSLSKTDLNLALRLTKLGVELVDEDYSGFEIFEDSLLPGPAISTTSYIPEPARSSSPTIPNPEPDKSSASVDPIPISKKPISSKRPDLKRPDVAADPDLVPDLTPYLAPVPVPVAPVAKKVLSLNDQLLEAIKNKNGSQVRRLVAQGANPKLSFLGRPVIMLAIENGCKECAQILYPQNKENKTLYNIGKTRRTIAGWMKAKKWL